MKKCFVVMGFGEKTDLATGRTLDLDKTYRIIIKKAVEEAGLECIRADDVIHSGVIDKPMYELLLAADLVIADLSTANANAIYELGVRHALRPHTTIVIAEKQFKFPFDLTHLLIRPYEHLGKGIDAEEAERVREDLKKAIAKLMAEPDVDSPVYAFLPHLREWNSGVAPVVAAAGKDQPTVFERTTQPAAATRGVRRGPGAKGPVPASVERNATPAPSAPPADPPEEGTSVLMDRFRQAKADSNWVKAREILQRVRNRRLGDEYITQQLALATYKSEQPDVKSALLEAHKLLLELRPELSTNPETLGLWGAVHKKLYDVTNDPEHLDAAIRAHEKGFYVKNDHYNGINFAFLLNKRASITSGREAQTDIVLAERVRRRVVSICEQLLAAGIKDDMGDIDKHETFFVKASLAEAFLGSGEPGKSEMLQKELQQTAPAAWMAESAEKQMAKLRDLLKYDSTEK